MRIVTRSILWLYLSSLFGLAACSYAQSGALPRCEWCGAPEAPSQLTEVLHIADADEPGERLTITGSIVDADGAPAPDVLVYAYHTNDRGVYPTRGDEQGNGRRHGYLRGWLLTDTEGRFTIHTIRPGTYPSRNEPAHIHLTLQPPGADEIWIDSIVFDADPLVDARYRKRQENRGGSGILTLRRDADGHWHGERIIRLAKTLGE